MSNMGNVKKDPQTVTASMFIIDELILQLRILLKPNFDPKTNVILKSSLKY